MKRWRTNNRVRSLLISAKSRARKANILFDLTLEAVGKPTHCPVFGIPLCWNASKRQDNSPSLDRVDPNGSYITTNVRFISWLANKYKSDMSLKRLLQLTLYVLRNTTKVGEEEHSLLIELVRLASTI